MAIVHHQPGDAAPHSGVYQSHNIFGSPTAHAVTVNAGERLPAAPHGFTWVLVDRTGATDN